MNQGQNSARAASSVDAPRHFKRQNESWHRLLGRTQSAGRVPRGGAKMTTGSNRPIVPIVRLGFQPAIHDLFAPLWPWTSYAVRLPRSHLSGAISCVALYLLPRPLLPSKSQLDRPQPSLRTIPGACKERTGGTRAFAISRATDNVRQPHPAPSHIAGSTRASPLRSKGEAVGGGPLGPYADVHNRVRKLKSSNCPRPLSHARARGDGTSLGWRSWRAPIRDVRSAPQNARAYASHRSSDTERAECLGRLKHRHVRVRRDPAAAPQRALASAVETI